MALGVGRSAPLRTPYSVADHMIYVTVINKPYLFVVVTRAATANTLVYIHSILVCEQTSEMDAATMFALSGLYRVILPS